MNLKIERSGRALEMPLDALPRVFLLFAAALVLASYALPLWNLTARDGVDRSRVSVYSTSLDVPLSERSRPVAVAATSAWEGLQPPGWMAVGLAAMALLFVRASLLGTTRSLIDSFVLYVFFSGASAWSFLRHLTVTAAGSIPRLMEGEPNTFALVASPASGAWVLTLAGLVLAAALFVAWRNTRHELSSDCLVVAG